MLLGLHTYSFHLHGMGQNWGGLEFSAPKAMNIFQLMDYAVSVGLEGLHMTPVDCESTDSTQLKGIHDAAKDRGLHFQGGPFVFLGRADEKNKDRSGPQE